MIILCLLQFTRFMAKLDLIENSSEIGAGTRGASLGIEALRVASLNTKSDYFKKYKLSKIDSQNHYLLEDSDTENALRIEGIEKVFKSISSRVSESLSSNKFPLILAGDHSSAGGTIAGIKMANPEARLGVVWIDAHGDLHTPYTTPSGNVHGMPLATALAEDNLENKINDPSEKAIKHWENLKSLGGMSPKILPEDLIFVAVRDTEAPEDRVMDKLDITNYTVRDVREKGMEAIANESLEKLSDCDLIYVSFDVDSMDCDLVSYGTGTPVEDGLTEQEAGQLINYLLLDKKVCCLEVVEINPCLDNKQNRMAETAFRILEKATSIITKR